MNKKKYFGTDGIRGKVGASITPEFALRLGYAAGKVLSLTNNKPSVIIAKDTRISGYLFESALEAGFAYSGVDVYMAGPLPTPAVAYLTRALRLSAGVVISASHNFYQDNGIKFFTSDGTKLSDFDEERIESCLSSDMTMANMLGKVHRLEDARGRYIEFCKNTFPNNMSLAKLKIVVDCANGAGYYVAPKVFQELGADVISINSNPNGTNINVNSGSNNSSLLVQSVQENHADIGIALDGDGDRVVMCDADGTVLNGDKLIYIIAKYYREIGHSVSGIVGTSMSNISFENACINNGYKFIRTDVGDRYIFEELKKMNWILGGEPSGHVLCLDKHTTGDAIISSLQVLSAILLLKKTFSQLLDWQDYRQIITNIPYTKNWNNTKIIDDVKAALQDKGRLVVRKSGTENVVRIMIESEDSRLAEVLTKQILTAYKTV